MAIVPFARSAAGAQTQAARSYGANPPMTFSTSKMARSARRAQFRLLAKPSNADANDVQDSPTSMQQQDPTTLDEPLSNQQCQTKIVQLYRQTFSELDALVDECDPHNAVDFFHAMRFMQLLGLNSDDVALRLSYRRENICRWMNGQRRPHAAMRKYVLKQCIEILREDVEIPRPTAFLALAEREPQAISR